MTFHRSRWWSLDAARAIRSGEMQKSDERRHPVTTNMNEPVPPASDKWTIVAIPLDIISCTECIFKMMNGKNIAESDCVALLYIHTLCSSSPYRGEHTESSLDDQSQEAARYDRWLTTQSNINAVFVKIALFDEWRISIYTGDGSGKNVLKTEHRVITLGQIRTLEIPYSESRWATVSMSTQNHGTVWTQERYQCWCSWNAWPWWGLPTFSASRTPTKRDRTHRS